MTVQFANITETRTKMTTLTKRALEEGLVILLKNGKPLLGLLDYKEVEGYNKWKEEQRLLKDLDFRALESHEITPEIQRMADEVETANSDDFIDIR